MSNALDAYSRPSNPLEENDAWLATFAVKYPCLADALVGTEGRSSSGPVRPPMSFILGTKDGRLRFSLSSRSGSRTYFGPIDDPNDVLGAAERCLAGNGGEWVTKQENGSSRHR